MKISFLPLSKLFAVTFTGLGIAFTIAPSASLAETNQDVYIPPNYQDDALDNKQGDGGSIYGGPQNGGFDPMSLIHRANFGTLNWQEFSSQNSENINSEAGSFREKQRRLLLQRQQQPTNGQNLQQQRNLDFVLPVYTPNNQPASN